MGTLNLQGTPYSLNQYFGKFLPKYCMRIQIFYKTTHLLQRKIVLISFTDNSCAINGIFYSFIYKKGLTLKLYLK